MRKKKTILQRKEHIQINVSDFKTIVEEIKKNERDFNKINSIILNINKKQHLNIAIFDNEQPIDEYQALLSEIKYDEETINILRFIKHVLEEGKQQKIIEKISTLLNDIQKNS